jgi:hypothetical protein
MATLRVTNATWTVDLMSGNGVVSASTSGAFTDLGVSVLGGQD